MTPACHAGWTCRTRSFVGSETSHLSRRPVFFKKRWNPRLFPALYRRRQSSPKANKSALDLPFLASVGLVGDGRLGEVRYDLWPRPALRLFWFCGLWFVALAREFGIWGWSRSRRAPRRHEKRAKARLCIRYGHMHDEPCTANERPVATR